MANKTLSSATRAKNDEFYTQLTDIEKELKHYRKHFKGKTVLCNCDDPFESNFFKYFVLNFNRLKIKKLIATCYSTSTVAGTHLKLHTRSSDGQMSLSFNLTGELAIESEETKRKPYKAIVNVVHDTNGDGGIDMLDVVELFKSGENQLAELDGDGDFRSDECIELLKESDIVVTYHGLLQRKVKALKPIWQNTNTIRMLLVYGITSEMSLNGFRQSFRRREGK